MSARRLLLPLCVTAAAAAWAISSAYAGGGSPGVLVGSKGVVATGGAVRYVTFSQPNATVVAAVLTRGGQVARSRWVRGAYGIPLVALDGSTEGLTRDGRTLVLAPANPGARGQTSRFALLDTRTLRVKQVVTLHGAFSYDALSPDGRTLYVIELLGQGAKYRVRAYDLHARRLLPGAIVDPHEADEPMVGSPATRVTSAEGRWVYTLYARPEQAPFIHALDARNRAARCIDLPALGSEATVFAMRLSLSARDRKLTVHRGNGLPAIVIDTRTFKTRRA